jgi:hypothetical protein
MSLDGHGLALRKARLLHWDAVEQNSIHGDGVYGRVHENVGRNA